MKVIKKIQFFSSKSKRRRAEFYPSSKIHLLIVISIEFFVAANSVRLSDMYPWNAVPEKRKTLFFVLFFPGSGRKNSVKKILTKNFRRKNSDEKIPTKKFRRKNWDEKIGTNKFGRKQIGRKKKLGARHGGKAQPLRRQGTDN